MKQITSKPRPLTAGHYTPRQSSTGDDSASRAQGIPKERGKEVKKKVFEYLDKNRLMALGTAANSKPWAATVFYAFDRRFNLIFYSRPDTKHCQHIKSNPHVSVVINHHWRNADGTIKGLQITGRASKVLQRDYRRIYALYKKRFKWADEFISDHILYLIRPIEIWYIDQKLFGHFYRVRVV